VAALTAVEDSEVIEDRVGQFDVGVPSLSIEQFGPRAAPE